MLAFAAQTAPPPSVGEPPSAGPPGSSPSRIETFDLSNLPATLPDAEIVVRANSERYRYKETYDPRFQNEDGKAEFGLFGDTRGAVETEAVEISPGVVSKRLMFRLKIPL